MIDVNRSRRECAVTRMLVLLVACGTARPADACTTVMVGYLPTTKTYRSIILAGNLESMTTGGLNEHGLSIAIEFLPMRPGLACDKGVVGPNSNHWTTSLIANGLLRAKTAREAIRVIGSMIDEYGFLYYRAPHAGVALPIADESETWLMEIFGPGEDWTPNSEKPGGVWCAQRIPDGEVGCSANRSRIKEVNLKDTDHFTASANIFSLARELGFWKPEKPFVWYEVYGGPGSKSNSLREWRALSLAAPSLGLEATGDPAVDRYPFSVKPDKPIAVETLIDVMRDGYQGTAFEGKDGRGLRRGAEAMHSTTMTFVAWGLVCSWCLAARGASEEQRLHEWPQLKGNSGFTGLSPDDSVKPPLRLVWSYRLDGDASGDAGVGVIVAGGKVFVTSASSHSLVALDADTGHFRWEHRDPSIGYVGYIGHLTVPSYDNGRVLLWQRHKSSAVTALDAETGSVLWTQPLSPLGKDVNRGGLPVADGMVYCGEGGPQPAIAAFETATGRRVWRTALGSDAGEYTIGPTVAGGRVFVATRANVRRSPGWKEWAKKLRGAVTALDAKNGDILWRRENVYPWCPMTSDGTVLACPMWSSADEKLHLLDCRTGETVWAKAGVSNHYYPPITLTNDLVLYQPWGPKLHAMSRTAGEPLWTFHNQFTSAGCCTPAVSGQFAYLGTSVPERSGDLESLRGFRLADTPSDTGKYGTMNAIDLSTGKSVWRFPTTNTICGDPAIAYGRLYFASRDGRAYCCAPAEKGEPTTPEAKHPSPPAPEADVLRLLSLSDPQPRTGSDWPMHGGGPDRVGLSGATLEPPLELAWKFDTQGRVLASAAMVGGVVYASSESGKIVAVDAKRGDKIWEFATGQPVRCSPAVAGGVVYCGSDNGILYALDRQTGKPVWQFEAGGPIQASGAVVGGVIVFGANDHNFYALDRRTGRKLWNFRTSGFCIQAPPVIHGDRVFAAGWADWVWCLDLKSGKPVWRSFIPVSIEAVSYYRDRLWVRSPYYVVELDPAKGTWLRIAEASYGYGGMAFIGNRLFQSGILGQYGTTGATAVSLDDKGGPPPESMLPTLEGVSILKPQPLEGASELASMAAPLALGNKLCFATLEGKVILTRLDGTQLWDYELGNPCHAPPVAADGLLVVGCDDGSLYAFREERRAN